MGHRSVLIGRDKHVPPEGRRGTLVVPGEAAIDDRTPNDGPDKRVPPKVL
ncbi:hypothetical protein THTE_4291 [Thermogutta terrifontis]|uniref:Uncharacterized protein n=1 Tax=Thermogutta terrifontis TaxID=1331910 RepID=A0A286RLQ5_9BACT|nr:hypothetical protein THTE_4291 [Thermogutta terrifontis]